MAGMIDDFAEFKVTLVVSRSTTTITNGVPQEPTWETIGTHRGLFWEGGAAQQFVSGRFRESVTAACALPVGASVRAQDRVTYGARVFSVIHQDNIGAASQALIVALQEADNA